jgi:histidine ammonia-lyase
MELLSSTQALDLLRPLQPAGAVLAAYSAVREHVPFAAEDRVFANDISRIRDLIRDETLTRTVHSQIGELEW